MNVRVPEKLRLDFTKKVGEWNALFQSGNPPFPITSMQDVRDRFEEKASFFLVGFYEHHLMEFNVQLFYDLNSKVKEVSRGDVEIYGLGQKNLRRLVDNKIDGLNVQAFELLGYFTYEHSWHSVKQELAKIDLSSAMDDSFSSQESPHTTEFQSSIIIEVKRQFEKTYSVSINAAIKGVSELSRLFHLYLKEKNSPIQHEIGIRIGPENVEVNHDDVDLLAIHCKDCRFSKGVYISSVGYTELAIKTAQKNGIVLCVQKSSRKLEFISRLSESESDNEESILIYFIPRNGYFDVPAKMGRKLRESILPTAEVGRWSVSILGNGMDEYLMHHE